MYSTRQTQGIPRLSFECVCPVYERVRTNAWALSNEKSTTFEQRPNAFGREAKHVQTRSQTHLLSDEKPNTFGREAKRVQSRSQVRSNKSQTRSNDEPTAFNDKANTF